jgi:3-deoxy-manno-octulosonate cytidylyltransferase (CMP-KDO synthetase)
MSTVAILPARLGSSRFPGKPLAPILGLSMIEHVYHRTAMSKSLSSVYVATCDTEICEAVERFGGQYIMTSDRHERASDRISEAMESLDAEIAVMVQGDEPMVHPDMIDAAVAAMIGDSSIPCVNLMKKIESEEEWCDPNTIKVVTGLDGRALYMSRSAIPRPGKAAFQETPAYKQVCIMPFRRNALENFASLAPTPLEISESIDMLRFIENGVRVHMVETPFSTFAVDTPSDLARVETLMRSDPLCAEYLEAGEKNS